MHPRLRNSKLQHQEEVQDFPLFISSTRLLCLRRGLYSISFWPIQQNERLQKLTWIGLKGEKFVKGDNRQMRHGRLTKRTITVCSTFATEQTTGQLLVTIIDHQSKWGGAADLIPHMAIDRKHLQKCLQIGSFR